MKKEINLKNLDKKNWKIFKFEDIAKKISETILPEFAEVEIYVGLEHIDRDNIHINKYGTPKDVKGGKLRCYPGDIIFGKRRAYQRKAAIVDFEGICSAHAFVFRANKNIIDPRLFPFFLHTDNFMNKMIDISVGGLSPTINWAHLKKQEFLLPPKNEQSLLAELFWAMDKVEVNTELVLKNLQSFFTSSLESFIEDTKNFISLGNIKIQFFKGVSNYDREPGKIKLLPSGSIFPRKIKEKKIKNISSVNKNDKSKELIKGDILFNSGGVGTLGRSHFFNSDANNFFSDSFVINIRINDTKFINKFIYYVFQSMHIQKQIRENTKGTTGITSISIDSLENFKIPNISINDQKKIVKRLEMIESSIEVTNIKKEKNKYLQKSLINKIL